MGDRHGNHVISTQRAIPLDADELMLNVSDDDDDDDNVSYDFVWEDSTFFHVGLEKAAKLTVVLIGDKEDYLAGRKDATLLPFHEGFNPRRVWKIIASDDNVIDGLITAER